MNPEPNIPHSRPDIDAGEIAAVVQALQAGHLSQGEEVARLERDLSSIFDDSEVVAVSSGTAALYLALVALGAHKGKKVKHPAASRGASLSLRNPAKLVPKHQSEPRTPSCPAIARLERRRILPVVSHRASWRRRVIIPSYTCQSLYAAVSYAGATPVCADTGKDSVCITSSTVKPLMDDAVEAIIVPHMFGFTADIKGLKALGCPVIEDCAQSAGGRYADGSLLGSKGHVAILSFYGTKLLPAGEGGACVTRHKELAETIRLLRNCDEEKLNPRAFNFKMGDLNAALARVKLKSLDAMNKRRELIAQRYDEAFGQRSFRKKSAQPQAVCFRYLVETERNIDDFLKQVLEAGITCRRPVWEPLHYTLGGKCPRTERLQDTLVSVPIYPGLSEDEVEKICRTLPKIRAFN